MNKIYTLLVLSFLMLPMLPANAQQEYTFDIMELPFSRYGSYTAFSAKYDSTNQAYSLFLRDVSGKYAWGPDEIFKIEATGKGGITAIKSIEATPWKLTAKGEKIDLFSITYDGTRAVRVKSEKSVGIELTKVKVDPRRWEWYMPISENQHRLHGGFDKYVLTAQQGSLNVLKGGRVRERNTGNIDPTDVVMLKYAIVPEKKSGVEFSLERYHGGWESKATDRDFAALEAENKAHFDDFYEKNPKLPAQYEEAALEAAYVNWSCVVEPRGLIKRPGMLMSKALMRHIWSWDHTFNALALAYDNPELAWDQMMVVFDDQQESGAVNDYINDHHTQIAFVKPPVHGLMLKRMMDRNDYFDTRIAEIYDPLTKWTNFWFNNLDDDKDGLPQYNHGCNSGWDNSTVFDVGFSLEGPDLSAFLVIQMEVLADIATKLDKPDEAKVWKERSEVLLAKLIEDKWNGEQFVFATTYENATSEISNSSMRFLPMLLGDRLPQEIRTAMLNDLKTSGLITDHGIATEHPDSPEYDRDGYWRGPIWAPQTYFLVEGIRLSGDEALANDIAQKFVDMCDKSGFRENFVAVTGEGLRDVGYTWTSSVFLVIAHDYIYNSIK